RKPRPTAPRKTLSVAVSFPFSSSPVSTGLLEPFAPAPAAALVRMVPTMVAATMMPAGALFRRKEPADDHEGNHNDDNRTHDIAPKLKSVRTWSGRPLFGPTRPQSRVKRG